VTGRLDSITHDYIMGDDDERVFAARSDAEAAATAGGSDSEQA
jgi:hypothetical protein